MSKYVLRSIFARLPIIMGLFVSFSLAASSSFSAQASEFSNNNYSVQLNKTQILRLPAAAATVVVGNPDIADISVHSSDTLFVIGRGYGQTNIIALDALGQTILDANITVQAPISASSLRIVNIGGGQESYNCAPNCLPAPVLGDTQNFIARYSGHAVQIVGGGGGAITSSAGASAGQFQNALNANTSSRSNPLTGPPSSRTESRQTESRDPR